MILFLMLSPSVYLFPFHVPANHGNLSLSYAPTHPAKAVSCDVCPEDNSEELEMMEEAYAFCVIYSTEGELQILFFFFFVK